MKYVRSRFLVCSLKAEIRHDVTFVINGGTKAYHNENMCTTA